MAIKKFAVGCFVEEVPLFDAVKRVRKSGYKLHDVYTPFLSRLDKAMGLRIQVYTQRDLFTRVGELLVLSSDIGFTNSSLNIGVNLSLRYRRGDDHF